MREEAVLPIAAAPDPDDSGTRPQPLAVATAVAGDGRGRLEEMFNAYHEAVWRTLRRRGLAPESAADATQQCFLIAAERLDEIKHGSERAFLLATALRLASTTIRADRRWQLEDDMDLRATPGARADDIADQRRAVALTDRVLIHLTPDLLEVFVLFEIEGLSTPEISRLVQVPLGTVASRLRRAREAFRATVARMERTLRNGRERGQKP